MSVFYVKMALIVQKFGGTSMGSIERIRNVANRVCAEIALGNQVVVVVSAMSGETDRLINLFKEATGEAYALNDKTIAEYDSVISTGEQVSSGLLSGMLNGMGKISRSFLGWQIKFKTSGHHSKASILGIDPDLLNSFLNEGGIPIIAGFQGVCEETGRQTTLGRGGSDTSAVAIAAALGADRCDIYTDVDGVYTADPRIVKDARKIDQVGYEEVLEMASSGAKVLEPRSVILAANFGVKVQVLSSFTHENGTLLVSDNDIMEHGKITNVTSTTKEVQVVMIGMPDIPGTSARLFGLLADNNILVDVIAQSSGVDGTATIAFTINSADRPLAKDIITSHKEELGYQSIRVNESIAKVSVIGIGMKSNVGVASTMFKTLAAKNINILTISTSEIKVTVLIPAEYNELAVRSLHAAFELEK